MTALYDYAYYIPKTDDGNCGICLEPLANGEIVVAHEEEGTKHPLHRMCARIWSLESKNCPSCRAAVDWHSLVTWKVASPKERVIRELKEIGTDAVVGTLMGAIGGALSGAIVATQKALMDDSWIEPKTIGMIVGAITVLYFVGSMILHRRDHPEQYVYRFNFYD